MNAAKKLMVCDLFCGAGGTSEGVAQACEELQYDVELLAINHWARAIATHTKNHPKATHLCANLDTIDPRKVVPGGRLDLLVASPECIFHSVARGGRPINDQSRASAFRVLEWCEKLDVANVLVENVPEFVNWAPIASSTLRPIKAKKGEIFRRWIAMFEALNYRVSWRVLNSADYGGATTRRRLFIIGRKRKGPIRWPMATHAKDGGQADLFGKLKPWRSAREIIDWSLKGQSIFRRKKPLAKTTLDRILAGFVKFGGEGAAPFIRILKNYIEQVYPPLIKIWEPVIYQAEIKVFGDPSIPEAQTIGIEPFITILQQNNVAKAVSRPLPTITAQGNKFFLCEPFVIGQQSHSAPRSVRNPIMTISTGGKIALIQPEPFILQQQSGGAPRSVRFPLPTIAGRGAQSLLMPFLIPFFGEKNGQRPRSHGLDLPLPAVTSHGAGGLVQPTSFLLPNKGFYRGWENGARDLNLPMHTITSRGAGGVVEGFIITPGGADLGTGRPVSLPLPTVLGHDRFAVVSPVVVNMKGRSTATPIFLPLPTQTTRKHLYVAEPFILSQHNSGAPRDTGSPVPAISTTSRGVRLIQGYMSPFERQHNPAFLISVCHGEGTTRRAHSLRDPLSTLATSNQFALVEAASIRARNAALRPVIIQTSNTGGNGLYARSTDDPLYTVVTENQLGLAQACLVKVNHSGTPESMGQSIHSPLRTLTAKNGFGVAQPFLVKFYSDVESQMQSIGDPLHTVPTRDRFGLVESEGSEVYLDIFFRMLRPKELARAMGFEKYLFTGTTEEQVKQIGNAVSVEIAKALVGAILSS